jgi:hypothetical protein
VITYPWKTAVCWDKDSTLADTSHRQWMVKDIREKKGTTWEDYARACGPDKPILSARQLMRLLAPHHAQVIMTGAYDCPEARNWLREHNFPYHGLYMREAGDNRPNGVLKAKWIKELQALGTDVVLFVEDWPEAAEDIRRLTGVPVLVLNPCYDKDESLGGSV